MAPDSMKFFRPQNCGAVIQTLPALSSNRGTISAGRVDTIVVYKIDRLTRSLADFAKIVEILDARGASFVSVTQQFNTTTSMGRLTLNILLSFARCSSAGCARC
jgi:site-specific DNA recombinase